MLGAPLVGSERWYRATVSLSDHSTGTRQLTNDRRQPVHVPHSFPSAPIVELERDF